jgi:hypothetical protein
MVEVVDASGVGRPPAKQIAGQCARHRLSAATKGASELKWAAGSLGDLATTGTFKRRPMISAMSRTGIPSSANRGVPGASNTVLKRQRKEMGGIKPVHRRPAVAPIATYAETPFLRASAIIMVAKPLLVCIVDRRREPYDVRP